MQVDQQGPTNTVKQCKSKPRTLKDAYKQTKDNNTKAEAVLFTCPFYKDIDEVLSTWDIVKSTEVCEVGVNEDDHINLSGSISMDTVNPAIILNADDTHHEYKEDQKGVNAQITVDESIIDHDNDELNSSFNESLTRDKQDKEKRELLVNIKRKQNRKTIIVYLYIN